MTLSVWISAQDSIDMHFSLFQTGIGACFCTARCRLVVAQHDACAWQKEG